MPDIRVVAKWRPALGIAVPRHATPVPERSGHDALRPSAGLGALDVGRLFHHERVPGRGKTHLAIAIAYRAIQNGFDAFFTTAAALIDDLSAAFRAGELTHALPTYTHPAVVVVDEVGSPTYTRDLADAILGLVAGAPEGGLFHLVNRGGVSRLAVAERVLGRCRPGRRVRPISRTEFIRASSPPPWAVLDGSRARDAGVEPRDWAEALDEYLDRIC